MRIENKMYSSIKKLDKYPDFLKFFLINYFSSKKVPFIKTTGLKFEKFTQSEIIVSIKNKKKVNNHIKGIHACVMALLAETSSGFILGINISDDKLILIKSMTVKYKKIAKGNMRAIATISDEQYNYINNNLKGDIIVPVSVYDETNTSPIEVEMNWAWIPKNK